MVIIIRAVHMMCNIIYFLLLARCICSWLYGMNNSLVAKIAQISTDLTEWLVAPCRKLISKWNNGIFDWSVLLAFLVLEVIEKVIVRVLFVFV